MSYDNLSDNQKQKILEQQYDIGKLSFIDLAKKYETYPNKLRRDAIKFGIKIRDKSEAQKNALANGSHKHPTKGKIRTEEEKQKIGLGVYESWQALDENALKERQEKAKIAWSNTSHDENQNILHKANMAVRESSKTGSKLENFLLYKLLECDYKVDFHKEQILSNTRLQIDLFLPTMSVAIEVDGPSHFEPVWGEDVLKKNQKYDTKKNGLILGKELVLIRIKQTKDYSDTRARILLEKLLDELRTIKNKFPDRDKRYIEIED